MKFPCPFCGGRIGATEEWFGLQVPCPHCGQQIQVPGQPLPGKPKPEAPSSPPPQPARSRHVQTAIILTLGVIVAGFTSLAVFSSLSPRGSFSEAARSSPPEPAQAGKASPSPPRWADLLPQWLRSLQPQPKIIACRLVDCLLDKAGERELGLADADTKVFAAVRMGIPASFFIPTADDYEAMKRSHAGDQPLPPPEQCRWFDAAKFQLILANGSTYDGLVLCRLCQHNIPGTAAGSAWGSTIGEVTFALTPSAVNLKRIEELEVCFAVNKTEAQARPYRLRFAGLELPVPVE